MRIWIGKKRKQPWKRKAGNPVFIAKNVQSILWKESKPNCTLGQWNKYGRVQPMEDQDLLEARAWMVYTIEGCLGKLESISYFTNCNLGKLYKFCLDNFYLSRKLDN